jgi:hypothetical protein
MELYVKLELIRFGRNVDRGDDFMWMFILAIVSASIWISVSNEVSKPAEERNR